MNVTLYEQRDCDAVPQKFDVFFKVCRNIIFELALFDRSNKLEGERRNNILWSFTYFQKVVTMESLGQECFATGLLSEFKKWLFARSYTSTLD